MKPFCVAIAIVSIAGAAPAAETQPGFTKKPTLVKAGGKMKVEFTVDRNTDVAVHVEDADGKIIRHLAAGVLGNNPPEPLKPTSLAQSLEWDPQDDFGKPAAGGPFKVRVLLGIKPEFARSLLHNRGSSGEVSSAGVGPGGSFYVFHKGGTANGNMG